jgi:small subunit ribosomal protein S2
MGKSAEDKKEGNFMSKTDLKVLLEAGVHFGHQARRWNPKMKPYIYTERDGIHVIDLIQTASKLDEAYEFIRNLVSEGGEIVFVGTKRQARDIVKGEATRVGAMYVIERWVGGLLTNFDAVHKNIQRLVDLRVKRDEGKLKDMTKKERLMIDREIAKIEKTLSGVDRLDRVPEALFIIDAKKEDNAVKEGRKMKLTLVALTDTNADPTLITYPIPSNDDALKSIALLTHQIADAYAEGKELYNKKREREAVKGE